MEIEATQAGINAQAPAPKLSLVAIVRDKDGNPRFDDPHNVPAVIMQSLTPSDIEYLNKLRNQ